MRPITIRIWQNLGTAIPGDVQVISAQVEDLAELSRQVDGKMNLTKVTPGDLICKVLDPDGAIWTFIQTKLAISTGLLPPWLEMYVADTRMFLGTVDPTRLINHRSSGDYSISVGAYDWSMQLSNIFLGAPTAMPWKASTRYDPPAQVINGNLVYQCVTGGISATSGGPTGVVPPITDGAVIWQYIAPTWQRPVPKAADNATASTQMGYSADWFWMSYGRNCSAAYFPDPCEWAYKGAVLTRDQAVFRALLPNSPLILRMKSTPSIPSWSYPPGTIVYLDQIDTNPAYFQNVANVWYDISTYNGEGQLNGYSPLRGYPGVTDIALPFSQFPAGTIVANANDGPTATLYQSTGSSWSTSITNTPFGTQFKIIDTTDNDILQIPSGPYSGSTTYGYPNAGPYRTMLLSTSPWDTPPSPASTDSYVEWGGNWTANFTLANPTSQDLQYWLTTVAVPSSPSSPVHALDQNSVDGIVVGDKIGIVSSSKTSTWTVAGVDPILQEVNTVEAVTDVPINSHIYWTPESQAELVMEDPRSILIQAISPFKVDLSKFNAPTTKDPLFGFIPLRPYNGEDLRPIGDIEPTATNIKVSTGANWLNPTTGAAMPSYSWTGDQDTGWTGPVSTAPAAPNSDWTRQCVSYPGSLLPYEAFTLNPFQRMRNRAYGDIIYRRENNGVIMVNSYYVHGVHVQTTSTINGPTYQYTQNGVTYNSATGDNFTCWSPIGANIAGVFVCYDHVAAKRLKFTGNALEVKTWSGSGWGAATNLTWPGGSYIQCAAPMIGSAGYYLGYAVDAVIGGSYNGSWNSASISGDRLELWGLTGGLTATLDLASHPELFGGTLTTTPYGVYLVCGANIAEIHYSAGTLSLIVISMVSDVDVLFENSLAARSASEIIIFGRVETTDTNSTTETYLFRITTPFSSDANAALIWSEKIAEGCPTLIGAMRDPTKAGRIIGHYGGSLWSIDTTRPFCIERFTPGGMSAMECVEHICQLFNALAIPDSNGTMHIVSRSQSDVAAPLVVDQVETNCALCWPEFATIVRISSQDSKFYYDSRGQDGGALLVVSNHPMCWSLSSCAAMSESLCDYLGQPRFDNNGEWFHSNPDTAPPWESIQLFTKLTVNGGTDSRLLNLTQNFIRGSAKYRYVSDGLGTGEVGGGGGTGEGSDPGPNN